MGKYIFIMALPFIGAWMISTWWKIRRARSERERTLLSRASLAASLGTILTVIAVTIIPGRGLLVALPIAVSTWFIYSRSIRAAQAAIRAEESNPDPVARAKQI